MAAFSYSGLHGVDQVTKTNYDSCTAKALKSYNSGSDKVTLDQAGDWYFICPTTGHCDSGMKLAITVSAASSTPSTPSPPSTTPTTPSTPTPTTPSPPSTTPSPPSTTSPSTPTASAATILYNMNALVIGASVVLALLLG
uniref:Phytocyanin domain-containing protein n=1 Tax=Nelumbo nucifera TaxID=4432 RepID=A0A822XA90_NELNU|nr:TPA_asm: hypothetical protein HUJ06_019827 [Nelumbo nucifera]